MKQPYINVHQVKCGDAFTIRFTSGKKQHTIIIDGGFVDTYLRGIKPSIQKVKQDDGKIDLWLLTHLDADHINGAVSFLRDGEYKSDKLVKNFWFNCFDRFLVPQQGTKKSVGKGIEIRDLLKPLHSALHTDIVVGKTKSIGDGEIQVLWPDSLTLGKLKKHWKDQEEIFWKNKQTTKKGAGKKQNDYVQTIELLAKNKNPKPKSGDITNRSSIAILFTLGKKNTFFMGDCYVSDVLPQLRSIVARTKKKLKLEYLKLPHHASKANFDPAILDLIDCKNFIISADGDNGNHLPSKETLSKILTHKGRDVRNSKINFIFNHDNQTIRKIFAVDKDSHKRYNFKCTYPKHDKTTLKLPL